MNTSCDHAELGNIAIIRGVISTDPTTRVLPGRGTVLQFDVSTRIGSDGSGSAVAVPVAWNDPSAAQVGIVVRGAAVTIVGTVRRRFFRVAGATQSRTEVIADLVVPDRQRKRAAEALRQAADRILDTVA
jgi:single-stranded DNA-binding protein